MVFCQPISNLRHYVTNKPPGVTFCFCLLALALSFIFLSAYSFTHTLPNPDVVKDWNHLLSSLAQYHLCVKNNTSSTQMVRNISSLKAQKQQRLHKETPLNSTTKSISVAQLHLQVPLTLTSPSGRSSQMAISLHTTFSASQLQLEGNEIFRMTIDFIANDACLTIITPTHLLSISPLPPACNQTVKNTQVVYTEARKELAPTQHCYSLQSKYDPTLQVMLTKEDQLVAVRHLLEVATVLLVVCLILCLSVSVTHSLSHRNYWKDQHNHNQPLIDN